MDMAAIAFPSGEVDVRASPLTDLIASSMVIWGWRCF
jgi:hypothetical protein